MSWKGKTWQIYFVAKRVWVSSLVVFVSEPYQIITWHVGKVLCCWNFHSTTLSKFGRKSTRGCQFCSDLGGRSLTRCHPSIDNFTPCAQPPRIRENPSYIANGSEKYFVIFWKKKNTRCILTEQMKTSKYWDKLTKLSPAMVWHQIPPPRYYISIIYIYMDHIPICASDPEHYFYPDFAYSPNHWISSGA